ncbi:MAG: uracil phosphoribosyltransferase [Myxococcaceae bacterium]|jgi:uracil phosphoribosyltransferase|nr:uracil phosphoribosyltransferase [Myxococcaceae bacterium]MCA3011133.1 uracil phosphoribosyltransferase [Myxococcaceae bacterium]
MKNVHVIKHPIIEHKLAHLRNRDTTPHEFRQIFNELGSILAYEATRDLALTKAPVETPMTRATAYKVKEDVVVAAVLRAAEGMLPAFQQMLPFAHFGHIGIYRDKSMNQTVEYYFKLPRAVEGRRLMLLDPLLATGDTCLAALDRLKQYKVGPIKVITILSAKVGIDKVLGAHPDVEIFTLSIEKGLDARGYLLPGLGDAGDRLFGTV